MHEKARVLKKQNKTHKILFNKHLKENHYEFSPMSVCTVAPGSDASERCGSAAPWVENVRAQHRDEGAFDFNMSRRR